MSADAYGRDCSAQFIEQMDGDIWVLPSGVMVIDGQVLHEPVSIGVATGLMVVIGKCTPEFELLLLRAIAPEYLGN